MLNKGNEENSTFASVFSRIYRVITILTLCEFSLSTTYTEFSPSTAYTEFSQSTAFADFVLVLAVHRLCASARCLPHKPSFRIYRVFTVYRINRVFTVHCIYRVFTVHRIC